MSCLGLRASKSAFNSLDEFILHVTNSTVKNMKYTNNMKESYGSNGDLCRWVIKKNVNK